MTIAALDPLETSAGNVERPMDDSSAAERRPDTWSARRARHKTDEKRLMARYFANHDFLVQVTATEMLSRTTVASILVNQGTTPSVVVEESILWVKQQGLNPDITWYTPGSLVPGILRSLRLKDPGLRSATRVFLFPGQVDPETEAVSGPETLRFAAELKRRFTSALLSAHSISLAEGDIYFNYGDEVPVQRACAKLYAAHKFLFFDSSKFRSEGDPGFGIRDLLASAETVTIYTVSAGRANDQVRVREFETLCSNLLDIVPSADTSRQLGGTKMLRLRIVTEENAAEERIERSGRLKPSETK